MKRQFSFQADKQSRCKETTFLHGRLAKENKRINISGAYRKQFCRAPAEKGRGVYTAEPQASAQPGQSIRAVTSLRLLPAVPKDSQRPQRPQLCTARESAGLFTGHRRRLRLWPPPSVLVLGATAKVPTSVFDTMVSLVFHTGLHCVLHLPFFLQSEDIH